MPASAASIRTVGDAYITFYKMFGGEPTPAQVRQLFGMSSDHSVVPFYIVFKRVIGRYLQTMEAKRLRSAKQRIKRMELLTQTDDGTITADTVISLLKRQKFCCALCSTYLTKDKHKQLDHIKPVSKQGAHTIKNVQWLCRTCNISKGNRYE